MFDYYDELGLTREELLTKIRSQVKEKRYQHMLRVEKAAIELAKRYSGNIYSASLAGLLHDYAKELSDDDFLTLIDKHKLDPELKNWGNPVWHGLVGWIKVRDDFDCHNAEILRAIEVHTVGARELSKLDMIVYVADYIEEGRDFPGVDKARKVAKESLEKAVAFETLHNVEHLTEHCLPIYPQTIETYNAYIGYLK